MIHRNNWVYSGKIHKLWMSKNWFFSSSFFFCSTCQSPGCPSSSLIKKSRQGLYQVHSVKAYEMLFHTVTPLTLHVVIWSLMYTQTRYAPRNFKTRFRNATYWRNYKLSYFSTLIWIYIVENKYNLSETTSFVCVDINQTLTISTTTFSILS